MGRWTQYDEDEYRLPEGMKRVGYDADTGEYLFSDVNGFQYKSAPHARYGNLIPADTFTHTPARPRMKNHTTPPSPSTFIGKTIPKIKQLARSLFPDKYTNTNTPGPQQDGGISPAVEAFLNLEHGHARSASVSVSADDLARTKGLSLKRSQTLPNPKKYSDSSKSHSLRRTKRLNYQKLEEGEPVQENQPSKHEGMSSPSSKSADLRDTRGDGGSKRHHHSTAQSVIPIEVTFSNHSSATKTTSKPHHQKTSSKSERDREKEKDSERERKEKDRARERERVKDSERERTKDSERERERRKEREKDRDREKDRNREKDRDREKERERDKERSHGHHRSKTMKDLSPSTPSHEHRHRHHRSARDSEPSNHGHSRSHSSENGHSHSRSHSDHNHTRRSHREPDRDARAHKKEPSSATGRKDEQSRILAEALAKPSYR